MPDTLQPLPLAGLLQQQTTLLRFSKVQLKDDEQRGSHKWQDDRKAADTPSPVDPLIEYLSGLRSCEGGYHVRRGREREG